MPNTIRVLGVDLASRSWGDNGTAVIEFDSQSWQSCQLAVVPWPEQPLSPAALANAIHAYAIANAVAAVSLDGPQGWREPGIGPHDRPGCGRHCEYEVQAQGKTGNYGKTYPQPQHGWIAFCIAIFDQLLARPEVLLANDPAIIQHSVSANGYFILEVFPTSIWRASGLKPLPGKRRTTAVQIVEHRQRLAARYEMPADFIPVDGSHDDLQALVATLPAVGLLGGLALPIPNGSPSRITEADGECPAHRVEGLIWDSVPSLKDRTLPVLPSPTNPTHSDALEYPVVGVDGSNPMLADEREPLGEEVLVRGVKLFQHLVEHAGEGAALGVGYADFAKVLHAGDSFSDLFGRGYLPSHSAWIVEFADQVTDAAGGPVTVTYAQTTIIVGMDSFIWPATPPHTLSAKAFAIHQKRYDYTMAEWETIFPPAARRILAMTNAQRVVSSSWETPNQ